MLGITWTDPAAKITGTVEARTRDVKSGKWSGWLALDGDSGQGEAGAGRGGTEPAWVGASDGVEVRVTANGTSSAGLPQGLRLDMIARSSSESSTPSCASYASGTRVNRRRTTRTRSRSTRLCKPSLNLVEASLPGTPGGPPHGIRRGGARQGYAAPTRVDLLTGAAIWGRARGLRGSCTVPMLTVADTSGRSRTRSARGQAARHRFAGEGRGQSPGRRGSARPPGSWPTPHNGTTAIPQHPLGIAAPTPEVPAERLHAGLLAVVSHDPR